MSASDITTVAGPKTFKDPGQLEHEGRINRAYFALEHLDGLTLLQKVRVMEAIIDKRERF